MISDRWFIPALQPYFKIGQGTIPAEYLHYERKRQTRDMEYLHRKIFPPREGAEYQKKNPEKMQQDNKIRRCSIEHEDILRRRYDGHQAGRFIRGMHFGRETCMCIASKTLQCSIRVSMTVNRLTSKYLEMVLHTLSHFLHQFFIFFFYSLFSEQIFSVRQPAHPPQELAATLQNRSAGNCKI